MSTFNSQYLIGELIDVDAVAHAVASDHGADHGAELSSSFTVP